MKKMLLFIAAVAILAACSKEVPSESPLDKYNGYDQFLKVGEIVKDLRIRGGVIGTVTYGLELDVDDPYFYVTYEITDGLDWEIANTYMYAGTWKNKPRSKRNDPRRFRFPHKRNHESYVTIYTYTIPIGDLPPYNEPGFVVTASALVYNPNKCDDGGYQLAWADWDRRFRCRGWGGYTNYYYNAPADPQVTVYASYYTDADGGTLFLDLINATEGETDNQLQATGVGTPPSALYHGATVDASSKTLFFTDYSGTDPVLMISDLEDPDAAPYVAGTLDAIPQSISYNNGALYYVSGPTTDGNFIINEVTFTDTDGILTIDTQGVYSTVPNTVEAINDIAFDPDGNSIYLIGNYDLDGIGDAEVVLIEAVLTSGTYYETVLVDENNVPIDLSSNPQIDYGDDGNLYMIDASISGGGLVSTISPTTGITVITDEDDVIIIDPFGVSGFGSN